MLSLHALRCFVAAAEEVSFTYAAKSLGISQQALSSHISKLEIYYEVKLFDRGIPMTLTDAGKSLLKHAKVILASVDCSSREVQDIKDFRQGILTIGITVTRGTIMLPPLLCAFNKLFPQIALNLIEGTISENILDALYAGTADLIIGYVPASSSNLVVTPLFKERFVILVPNQLMKEHFHSHYNIQLSSKELSIGLFREMPFVAQSADTKNGEVFQMLCKSAGIRPRIVVTTQNLITAASLCMEGLGACVLPLTFLSPNRWHSTSGNASLFSKEGLSRVSMFLLDSHKAGSFDIGVYRLKNKFLSRAGREFISIAQDIYSELPLDQIFPPQHSSFYR